MGCGESIAKMILFVFNFIFFLLGAALLGLGVWITLDKSSLIKLTSKALDNTDNMISNTLNSSNPVQTAAYILIGVGAIIFLVGFCGCCGACTENKCLLAVFAVCIVVVIIIEIVGAVLIGIYRNDVDSKLETGLLKIVSQKYIGLPFSLGKDEIVSLALDEVMIRMKCCGIKGAQDFEKPKKATNNTMYAARWYKDGRFYSLKGKNYTNDEVKLPISCCQFKSSMTSFLDDGLKGNVTKDMKNPRCPLEKKEFNDMGCYDSMKEVLMKHATIIIAVVAGIICFEIIMAIVAVCFMRSIDKEYQRAST